MKTAFVDDVVEGIDLKGIEKRYDGPGSPAYHPEVMMLSMELSWQRM